MFDIIRVIIKLGGCMKKRKKKNKNLKLIMLIIMVLLIIFIAYNVITKNKLKTKGYNNEQINKFYELSFDINLILDNQYCNKIDEVLNSEYDKKNLESYLKKCNEPKEPEIIEKPEVQKDPFVVKLEQEKYYIPDNLERYISYSDGIKTTEEIVRDVNCNIDKDFYTDIKDVDLSNGNLILVNKYYYLGKEYSPKESTKLTQNKYSYWDNAYLAKDAQEAFTKMVDDAKESGYSLMDTSAYRSYDTQEYLFNKYLKENGVEWTLKSSAKPGHSEHQTGLATDVVKVGVSMYDFGTTKEFNWVKDNAHLYGFILRYPEGKEYLTGYMYEPWHYRYVGKEVAKYIYENDIVFEEYFAYFCEYKKEC